MKFNTRKWQDLYNATRDEISYPGYQHISNTIDSLVPDRFMTCYGFGTDDRGRGYRSTICVIWKDENRFIGISICKDGNPYDKKFGREVAAGRAFKTYTKFVHNNIHELISFDHVDENNHVVVCFTREAEVLGNIPDFFIHVKKSHT